MFSRRNITVNNNNLVGKGFLFVLVLALFAAYKFGPSAAFWIWVEEKRRVQRKRPFGINSLLAVKHNIMLSQSRQMWTYSTTTLKAVESFSFQQERNPIFVRIF